jgi:hypothetical protein
MEIGIEEKARKATSETLARLQDHEKAAWMLSRILAPRGLNGLQQTHTGLRRWR